MQELTAAKIAGESNASAKGQKLTPFDIHPCLHIPYYQEEEKQEDRDEFVASALLGG